MVAMGKEQNVRVPASEQTERKFNKTRPGKAQLHERRCRTAWKSQQYLPQLVIPYASLGETSLRSLAAPSTLHEPLR